MKFFGILILVLTSYLTQAQNYYSNSNSNFKDRLYYGGFVNMNFSNYSSTIGVSPIVGYKLTDEFSFGVGLDYIYYKYKSDFTDFETSVYGYKSFAQYRINTQFIAMAEFENLNVEFFNQQGASKREWVPGFFIGGGYYSPISDNAGFIISLLYNLMYDEIRSITSDPLVYRFGFVAGF